MDYIPESLKFLADRLGFSRSRFRLETQGQKSISPGQTLTIQLPENALIDLKSFRIFGKVETNKDNTVSAKAPADFASLISSMSVYCGGVCISQNDEKTNIFQ